MIVSSIILVLTSCMTLVFALRQSSARDVGISIACGVVSGAVLVMSVKTRSAARLVEAGTGYADLSDSGVPPFLPDEPVLFRIADATVAGSYNGAQPEATPAWGLHVAHAGVPVPPPVPVQVSPAAPPLEVARALDLQVPAPGALGRIRRPPLAGSEGTRVPLSAHDPEPGARRSGGEACGAVRRSESDSLSASAVPGKAAAGRRRAAGGEAPAPAAPSPARERATRKQVGEKPAGATGPSGVRQESRNGAGAARQVKPKEKAASR